MKRKTSKKIIVLTCLLTAAVTFLSTVFLITGSLDFTDIFRLNATFKKIEEIDAYAQDNYIKSIDVETLETEMISGYLMGLDDPYADYYTYDELAELTATTEGSLVGIGVSVTESQDGNIEILTVYPNSPAYDGGLSAGDKIVKVDNTDVSEIGFDQAVSLLRGEVDTEVNLTVVGNGEEKEISLTRKEVEIPSVSYQMDGENGYIKITEFNEATVSQFQTAIDELISQGAKGLIFDLRDNGGGTLKSVCEILDILLPEGELVTQVGADGIEKVLAVSDENQIDLPMAVITNENTASAAELFTCDIKDYGKGIQVGETTYGKGVMQTTHFLNDSSAVKLTTAYYNPAKSDNYDGVGLTPDYEVSLNSYQKQAYASGNLSLSDDPQYQQAVLWLAECR